ncbi:MAG: hypothetical protein AAGE18_11660 [Pseudomonadota bacterium]
MAEAKKARLPWRFLLVVLGLIGAFSALLLVPGRLAVTTIEVDTLHVLDGARRLLLGLWPHLDHPTPLGVLSFAPVTLWLALGAPDGMALILGNVTAMLAMIPGLLWLRMTRLGPRGAFVLALWTIVLTGALVHGRIFAVVDFALAYNRWSWAILALLVVALMAPVRGGQRHQTGDGLLFGLGLSALALMKVTYFVALAPVIAIHLVRERQWHAAVVTVGAGLLSMLLVTVLSGSSSIWLAYAADLIQVSTSEIRPRPQLSLTETLMTPRMLSGFLALLFGIILLRRTGQHRAGLLLLLLAPGFVFITYQNWGNEPLWLLPVAVIFIGLKSRSGRRLTAFSVFFAALVLPTAANMAWSPIRHIRLDLEGYVAPLAGGEAAALWLTREHVATEPLPEEPTEDADIPEEPLTFAGETLPPCTVKRREKVHYPGLADLVTSISDAAEMRVLLADHVNPLWLHGAGRPIETSQLWYYGGSAGEELADLAVLPHCPISQRAYDLIVERLDPAQYTRVAQNSFGTAFRRITQ